MSAQRRPATKRDRGQVRGDAAAAPQPAAASGVPAANATNGAPAAKVASGAQVAKAAAAPRPASSRPPMPPPVAATGSRPPKPEPDRPPQGKLAGGFARRTEGLRNTYRDTAAELKKVNWPDRETTRNLTIVVIAVSIVLGILLGGVDFLLRAIFAALP